MSQKVALITGATGQFHTKACKEYGTQMVSGVTPGKGGTSFEDIPIFDTVARAVAETAANASVIYVPPPFAADAIMEAADAQIRRVSAASIEVAVIDQLRALLRSPEVVMATWRAAKTLAPEE